MKRLIQHGLMFGNLIEVSSPALVARYNRALDSLTGKTTDLTDFHIDLRAKTIMHQSAAQRGNP